MIPEYYAEAVDTRLLDRKVPTQDGDFGQDRHASNVALDPNTSLGRTEGSAYPLYNCQTIGRGIRGLIAGFALHWYERIPQREQKKS